MHGALEKNPVAVSANGTILAGFVLIALLFVVGGSWAHFARLSGAVIAQGQVTVEGRTKTVQHPDGGVVAQILIGEGDRVERGDLLLLLDDTLLKAERGVHRGRLRESLARKARLEAERDDAGAIAWYTLSPKPFGLSLDPRVRAGQQNLFEARRQTRLGRISMLTERVAQFENQIDGTEALNRSLQRQVVSLDTELEAVRALKEKGLVRASRVLELERRRETLVGQIAGHDAEVARVRNAIGEARIEMLQIDREFRQDVLARLRDVEVEINDSVQNLAATRERLRRVEIRAPVSGEVHGLSVVTIGGVLSAGEEVVRIVPQTDRFEVEVFVEPRYVDNVFSGQSAVLRFPAFSQRTTPDLTGTVRGVSADVVTDEGSGLSVYAVRLAVAGDELARLGERDLVQGMPVEAFIQTGERSVLDYLLRPLSDQLSRAFREQ